MRAREFIVTLFVAVSFISLVFAADDTRSTLLAITPTAQLGGDLTVGREDKEAFKQMAPNAGGMRFPQFMFGQRQFTTEWDPAPGEVPDTDGLGPTFNAIACASCHINNGRGRPPQEGEEFKSILVRLSVPGDDGHGGPAPLANYGGQLQHRAVDGVLPEGAAVIEWQERPGKFSDGTSYSLRRPELRFDNLAFGDLPTDTMYSLRVANPVMGLGLLESVPAGTLIALADPADTNGDGISGRLNKVWDSAANSEAPGRFGWKANVPSLRAQSAGAALGDMGITTTDKPDENCPPAQEACLVAAAKQPEPQPGNQTEVIEFRPEFFEQLLRYMQLLAVPAQRDASDSTVQTGQGLFYASGCIGCHAPTLVTGTNDQFPELANQTIHPYTDLLLHDMGAGLADGRPDYLATGSEWRTPPLWGLGLSETVTGHSTYLHDGRARSISEAILWHGGEAEAARNNYLKLPAQSRAALLVFLQSL
jgi:CxxC motif-containing protein (DUF1111 family)